MHLEFMVFGCLWCLSRWAGPFVKFIGSCGCVHGGESPYLRVWDTVLLLESGGLSVIDLVSMSELPSISPFFTPLKINMEPKNHPIEKESHLPNLHF